MSPETSPFQNGVPAAAPAPLTERVLRQLQQAQAEEAQKAILQHSQRVQRGTATEYSPPVQSPIPPGSPAQTVSSAGGPVGNAVEVGGFNNANSLSQASTFAFAAQQQQYQHQFSSRDVSGGSHVSQPGKVYQGGPVSPRSGHSGTSSAAAVMGAVGVANGGFNANSTGRGAGSPTPPSLEFQPAVASPAVAAFQQWPPPQQHLQQQAPQRVFNLPMLSEYHHVASSMWPGLLDREKSLGNFLLL